VNRTATVAIVAVSAPLGAVLALGAVTVAAWADWQRRHRHPRKVPWNLA
jgi:hypothetical protein